MKMMIISVILSAMIFPLVGKLCDKYDVRNVVPYAFLTRFVFTLFFSRLQTPDSYEAYAICVFIIIASIIEMISVDSIFAKALPKETRGILNGAYSFAGQLGILLYSMGAGYVFDNIGPNSPFVLVGIADFSFAMLCFAVGLKNKSSE